MQVAAWLDWSLPKECIWWHTPNGGKRNAREAARLKRMGVKAGVPDIVIFRGCTPYFIELKSPKGRETPTQITMNNDLRSNGIEVALCKSLDEVITQLKLWEIIKS